MAKLKGKVALITGAGRGIGYGIAKAFAKEGANLVITGRTEKTIMAVKEKFEERYKIKVLPVVADGADEKQVENVIAQIKKKFGKLDILVNNAQTSKSGLMLEQHTKDDFDLAIGSGLYATFFYMREAFPMLKESKGAIINFASGAGLFGKPGQSSYAAAKEGIRGLSRVAATEWGRYGININIVCPLAMTEGLEKWKEEYPEMYAQTIQSVPMGRFADPEKDIGKLCVFLASDDAAYITGETITVQGGSGLRP